MYAARMMHHVVIYMYQNKINLCLINIRRFILLLFELIPGKGNDV